MAVRMWTSRGKTTRNWRGFTAAALVLSVWSGDASALEIKSTVSKVNEAGKIEVALPVGAMVAVGDKVRIEVSVPGTDALSIKTRWTVKGIEGQTILASPDGEPTNAPKVGFVAVINTIATQPAQTKPTAPAVDVEPAVEDKKPEPVQKTEKQPEEKVEEKVEIQVEPKTPEPPKAAPVASKAEEPAEPVVEALKTPEIEKPSQSAEEAKPVGVDVAKQQENSSDVLKGNVEDSPAPEHECDRLAAHPFDPDAVVKGLDYKRLNATQIIAVCNEAIAEYPSEARFYTQLTRGLHKAGKLNEAFDATKKGADLGSAHSMAYLGVMYKLGEPVTKDLKQSLFWFEKAAENGNPGGMVFAAAMYRDGTGTPRDYKRAAKLYQQASDLDVAEAMSSLGVFYDRGQGVEKTPEKAASYLMQALLGDDKQAQQLLFEASGAISAETRKKIQTNLKNKGFYKGKIDGDFGSRTREALTRYRSGRKGG